MLRLVHQGGTAPLLATSITHTSLLATGTCKQCVLCSSHPPQLNPGAVLNHKYTGENAVRAAGLPYCVLRPTGLTNESEPGDFLLEASQGEGPPLLC